MMNASMLALTPSTLMKLTGHALQCAQPGPTLFLRTSRVWIVPLLVLRVILQHLA